MALIWLSCAWIAGIYLGYRLDLPFFFIFVGVAPLPLLFFVKQRRPLVLASLGIIALTAGAVYSFSGLNTFGDGQLRFYNDRGVVEIKGMVAEAPDARDRSTRLRLSVEEVRLESGWREISGEALVFVAPYPEYEYGDMLKITGVPETPGQIEDFDYKNYLAHQGIYTVVYFPSVDVIDKGQGFPPLAWVYSLRQGLAENIAGALPEPQASVAQGIILGMRGNIPDDVRDDFAVSGTAHLLAISGLHLGIMTGILLAVGLWLFGRRHYLYVYLAMVAVWVYVLLTGMHLPVIRGAIMATVFLLAELLGRQRSAITALTFAAAVMVGISPYILGDASFQLSFLAMAGLVFIFPVLRDLGRRVTAGITGEGSGLQPLLNAVTDAAGATLAALLAVWPIVAYYFGIVSLAGPVATLLALPVLPLVIITGGITGILGFASAVVAQGFGWLAWLFLSYMLLVVNGLASPAVSALELGKISPAFLWVYYIVLAAALWVHGNRHRLFGARRESGEKPSVQSPFRMSLSVRWLIVPLATVAVLAVFTAATMPDDKLHVSFLDVGEGDAILIQKGSRQVLVDGGPGPQAIGLELGERMPYWDRTIDLLVLTHPHADHLTGLVEVARRYRVGKVMQPGIDFSSPLYLEWRRLIEEKGIEVTTAQVGQRIDMGDGIFIDVLNPPEVLATGTESDPDNNSVVLRLKAGGISFLLTGDIMREVERELIRQGTGLNSTVLKAAHHGSGTSSAPEFLAAVDPDAVVICCGEDNRFGHPHEAVICRIGERLSADRIFLTSANGTIEFITDGVRLWVKTDN